jgi:hypothetical protein
MPAAVKAPATAAALTVTAGPAQAGVQINNGTVYLTVTQYVRNDGRVSTVMGGRL